MLYEPNNDVHECLLTVVELGIVESLLLVMIVLSKRRRKQVGGTRFKRTARGRSHVIPRYLRQGLV